jgi:predicted phosphodiesterase
VVPFELETGRFIILSDQHKGNRDAADDFAAAEKNYRTALDFYLREGFTYINLGDCEELWKNEPAVVMKSNAEVLASEVKFLKSNRYYRIFGNHDLAWKYPLQRNLFLRPIFGRRLKVYEGIVLQTTYKNEFYSFFLAHGHQGDKRSDGNAFSMWFVAAIWTPIQRFLDININTTSSSFELVDAHNIMMYEWSTTHKKLIFMSGHTHKPVFASLDHIDMLTHQLETARQSGDAIAIEKLQADLSLYSAQYAGKKFVKTMAQPSYFNSGCCCFLDGDITGIEIDRGNISLVKWKIGEDGEVGKKVLQSAPVTYIFDQL